MVNADKSFRGQSPQAGALCQPMEGVSVAPATWTKETHRRFSTMTKAIRRGLTRDEGFTLIELMVVVMIIAVLIAIAIPSFLGFRKSAQDRSAQSEVRNVLLAEKAYWLDNGDYTETAGDITAFEPNANLHATAPATGVVIDLRDADSDIVCLTRTAESGNTFAIWESASGGTYYGETDLSAADCPAAAPTGYVQGGW
jgi:type IV pilus assembly protein PilA